MCVRKIMIKPFFKRKLRSNISLSRRYSDRIILWHYSFCAFTIAYLRRFLDDKLDLCGTDCYFSPKRECSRWASSFWSPFSFSGPLCPSSLPLLPRVSDEENRIIPNQITACAWAFKAFLIIPHLRIVAQTFFDAREERTRKRNLAGERIADRYRSRIFPKSNTYEIFYTRSEITKRPKKNIKLEANYIKL